MPSVQRVCQLDYARERMWEPGYLKARCADLRLESEFRLYRIRLWKSYLLTFFVLHIFVTSLHCALLLATIERRSIIYFDVALSMGCALVLILVLSVNFCDEFIAKHTWYMYASSIFASLTLVFADLTESIYHTYAHNWILGTFYDTYIIYMIYMFLPIHFIEGAVLLALLVSGIYILYFVIFIAQGFVEFMAALFSVGGMSVDIVHYLCLNLVGIFYRVINDTVVRSSFLDRHQYIKEKIWLRNARLQEKQLLDSILPPQISLPLQKDIQGRIVMARQGIHSWTAMERTMAIQIHPDVSILYADVVNYTQLTTTLTVEKLVKVLHDLYGRFDMAASRFKVQRIKFLGDCYYCVAGLSEPDPDHADNCVSLGLFMITHIMEVRSMHSLDINMRIGVHSGNLFAGVIGEAKLQFDIWGLDVTIASVLEATGVPGAVHISGATLNHLNVDRFAIENGPEKARDHPILKKYRIGTYTVREDFQVDDGDSDEFLGELHALSLCDVGAQPRLSEPANQNIRAVFQEELREEFRKMPVSAFNPKRLFGICRFKTEQEVPAHQQLNICLTFNDPALERAYLKQTDYMFKYSIILSWCVGCSLVYIELMDTQVVCPSCFILPAIVAILQGILTFIAWYKKYCWTRYGQHGVPHHYNRFSCFIFKVHDKIINSLPIRICIYLFLVISSFFVMCVIVMSCKREDFEMAYIEERLFHYEQEAKICFHPWVTTNMLSLMICLTFTFTRIPIMVKTAVAILETLGYMLLVFFQFDFVFHHSVTTNPSLKSEYAHALLICITFLTMFVKERQIEFTNKVNFNWRVDLRREENEASLTNHSIIIILNNILPSHIVDVYLNSLAKHELYYENYKMVSVMFAMLINFEMDLRSLRVLNEIIAEFDTLLLFYKEYYTVEKIKIVGCTYMAACGLDLNFAGSCSTNRKSGIPPENLERSSRRLLFLDDEKELEEVVFVMTSYALDMMRTLAKSNQVYQNIAGDRNITDGTIAIGISSGEVMAGIVGASQPHYDIWGNPVNMASRMESTGLPGHIQVTEESSKILQDFGISCSYRGLTFVKGRGQIPTYLVDIDENLNFISKVASRLPSHQERSTVISLQSTYSHPDNSIGSMSRHTFQSI
ncbi:adenylyl cyclase X E [Drosophila santomea]|uniref:adenylyl cyclase X E n=1 Tax=Drosophila santomea TaxID=129105 RepID=UPI001953E37B|nr:adenylyl cyclase X E [Drosophila santomea]